MPPSHIGIGLTITAATVAALVIGFSRSRRRHPFPVYGWLGIAALGCAEWLLFSGRAPVTIYFTPIAWSAWVLIVDAAVLSLTARSRLNDAPIVFARMALLSIPLWLIFEAYNIRLRNWTYVGLPHDLPARLFGYIWSFATITPAIFETSDLVQAILPPLPIEPRKISHEAENILMVCGAACLIVPVVLPVHIGAYLFAFVWIGFVLLLDPLNRRLSLPSFLGDLSEGFSRRTYGFLASGWICGWLWEFWNNWAQAKWHYTFRILQNWKIFEMPAPGFLGFFALRARLLCHVRHRRIADRLAQTSEMMSERHGKFS